MKKRLKSFFITAASLAGTAFFAVVLTPEFSSFLAYARETVSSWGVPSVVIALVGVFVSELWKQYLNYRIVKKMGRDGFAGSRPVADYDNELY